LPAVVGDIAVRRADGAGPTLYSRFAGGRFELWLEIWVVRASGDPDHALRFVLDAGSGPDLPVSG